MERKLLFFSSLYDFFIFLLVVLFILSYSLFIQYNNYKNLQKFDEVTVKSTILKQYYKVKANRTYQVLKLKSDNGFVFYTTTSRSFPFSQGKKILIKIFQTDRLTFYEYMTSFYRYTKILKIFTREGMKYQLNTWIANQHNNEKIGNIYQALYSASLLPKEIQVAFSNLGISHLIAISGFHLSILSGFLLLLFRYPYQYLQSKYFPYRSFHRDSFVIIFVVLLGYLIFLDFPPSLVRAMGMLFVGFILYDRGYEIFSMQTLFVSVILLLAFLPKLFFSIGFWLSVSGVFYIFLYLIYLKQKHLIVNLFLLPLWLYLVMLPESIYLFHNFSIYHPFSIFLTILFNIFYPLSIILHCVGVGNFFDEILIFLLHLSNNTIQVEFSFIYLAIHFSLSTFAIFSQKVFYFLWLYSIGVFLYLINTIV